MTFKTNLEATRCPALAGFAVVEVEGRGAAAFLQAQSMNDVAALAPGRWQWNGLLTPKGRVMALFALACVADGRFLMVLPDRSRILTCTGSFPALTTFTLKSVFVGFG